MTLRAHDRVGPYELHLALGEGALGDVWQARDTSNGRIVALRILPSPPTGDPTRFTRFENDVRKLIALRHPNVARVYELIDADGVRALACERVAGDALAKRIAAGSIPVDETVRIIAQVANGLAAAHARDLVHGDVKPSNITLCADGTVKVVDLGLVEVYDPGVLMPPSDVRPAPYARLLGAITGTAAYMSPEQIAGHAADSRADVWAFGCVLYEMLTGRTAFGGDEVTDTMARVTGSEPEWALIPPDAPASLVRMLRRCLDKDVLRRFQRMTDVLGPIRATLGEEGAVEVFLRQSTLRRIPHGRIEPDWSDRPWLDNLLKQVLPPLKRWARGRLPRGLEDEADDLVQETVIDVLRRLEDAPLRHLGAVQTYLRQSVKNRIRDVAQRHRELMSDVDDVEADIDFEVMTRYRDVLGDLEERDRALIKSRVEDQDTYDDIATRFSFPTMAAARTAVRRACKRLAELMTRKKN